MHALPFCNLNQCNIKRAYLPLAAPAYIQRMYIIDRERKIENILLTWETFPSNKQAGAKLMILKTDGLKVAIIFPWNRYGLLYEQTWILYTHECYVPSLVENWPCGSGVEDF